ncbi:MAG: glycosyltransferase family 4 protein, partial [Phycisphaeraceae bacterium]
MNVLFLTRYDVREFGVAEVIRGLAAALGARGVRVVVASSHPSTEGVHIAEADACHHLPLPHPRLLDAPSSVRSLSELCQRHRIDLVHCHGLYRPGHAARLLRKATGIPYIVTSHNIMPAKRARRWRVRHRCRRILKDAAAVTCFNRVMARDIHGFLDTRAKTWIIPNGLDLAQWSDSPAPADVPVVLGIGRVVWDKGFDMLVEAAAHLRDAPAPPAWVIAGEGEMKPELEARARQLGLNV